LWQIKLTISLIPYGIASIDASTVDVQGGRIRCPTPFIPIVPNRDKILRLNGGQYDFPEEPNLRSIMDARAQLDFLHDHLRHYCDLWARPPKLFLECYFAFISAQVEANETQLAEKLAPYGTLFSVQDWILSAPRPLPRAHIRSERAYWPVDFAFWLGDRVLAVLLKGLETATSGDQVWSREVSGFDIVELEVAQLARDGAEYLARSLPAEFHVFWAGEPMPSSPFKGTFLDEIICEQC